MDRLTESSAVFSPKRRVSAETVITDSLIFEPSPSTHRWVPDPRCRDIARERDGIDRVYLSEKSTSVRILGIHPSHLNRVFRARHGCSIGEYARRLRVERASRDLAGTKTPIVEIAASDGFARITGVSPAPYRKLNQ